MKLENTFKENKENNNKISEVTEKERQSIKDAIKNLFDNERKKRNLK